MKIFNLTEDAETYTCNVYFLLGSWNALEDMNTLVDTGRDPAIFKKIDKINTGVGKKKVDQVVITHNHYDHTGMLEEVCSRYRPKRVFSFSPTIKQATDRLYDGQSIRMGDGSFRVIYCGGHSTDSICLFNKEEGILFSGDNSFSLSVQGSFSPEYIKALSYLMDYCVCRIYYGHGKPEMQFGSAIIERALKQNTHKKGGY